MSAIDELINMSEYELGSLCDSARREIDTLRGQYNDQAIKLYDFEQRAAQLEAERDMYKQGFDALTTANEQIVKERDRVMLQNRVYGDLSIEAARKIDELRSEQVKLLDTIAQLKAENEKTQSEINYLRSTDRAPISHSSALKRSARDTSLTRHR